MEGGAAQIATICRGVEAEEREGERGVEEVREGEEGRGAW